MKAAEASSKCYLPFTSFLVSLWGNNAFFSKGFTFIVDDARSHRAWC